MIPKNISAIGKADLDSLVSNSTREGKSIEYKEILPGGNDQDRKEFLADISSLANASGGDVIYGVIEQRDGSGRTTGIPQQVSGLAGVNADQEILRLEEMIRSGIEPRIQGVQTMLVGGFSNGPALVLRVPRSWGGPHMVTYKGTSRFYSRTSNGKFQLDVAEIRSAFVEADALPTRIREFRASRLGMIAAGEGPVPLPLSGKLVLHLMPIASFVSQLTVDLSGFYNHQKRVESLGGHNNYRRMNLDGFVNASWYENSPAVSYVQIFRNGIIESVDAFSLAPRTELPEKCLYPNTVEQDLIKAFQEYMELYVREEIEPPIVVMVSLIGIRGYSIHVGERWQARALPNQFDRDIVPIPEITIEDLGIPAEVALRPIFDAIWQAAGFLRSANYDDAGRYRNR